MAEMEKKEDVVDRQDLIGDQAEIVGADPVFTDNETETIETESSIDSQKEEYVDIYSGQALNAEQLFRFSAREDANVVLIAGPYSSGKTTLIVMLYRLFLKGYNRKFHFAGSITMRGFDERSENLLCSSGNAEPIVTRTSRTAEDCYLHLVVAPEEGAMQNLFFADISGEKFSDSRSMEIVAESFGDSENVIVVVDGEKICNSSERQHTIYETKMLLKRLLNSKILSKRTKLQIVFTKKDKIERSEQRERITETIKETGQKFIESFAEHVYSITCMSISALSTEEEECANLEQILQNCMETVPKEDGAVLLTTQYEVKRNFDKFQMRGRVPYV